MDADQNTLIGFEFRTELAACFQSMVAQFGLERLITLDANILWREPEPNFEDMGYRCHFFESQELMENFLQGSGTAPLLRLAVTWQWVEPTRSMDETWNNYLPISEVPLPIGATFLGYDVAEDGLLSGLLNMDCTEDRLASHRHLLNQNGLFIDQEDALQSAVETDEWAPEHAPFRVFGIYELDAGPMPDRS